MNQTSSILFISVILFGLQCSRVETIAGEGNPPIGTVIAPKPGIALFRDLLAPPKLTAFLPNQAMLPVKVLARSVEKDVFGVATDLGYCVETIGQPTVAGWVLPGDFLPYAFLPQPIPSPTKLSETKPAINIERVSCDKQSFTYCSDISLQLEPYARCFQNQDWTIYQFLAPDSAVTYRKTRDIGNCQLSHQDLLGVFPGSLHSLNSNSIKVQRGEVIQQHQLNGEPGESSIISSKPFSCHGA